MGKKNEEHMFSFGGVDLLFFISLNFLVYFLLYIYFFKLFMVILVDRIQ